ncbi:hypothetical protein C8R48DRAFT_696820 [Suillus tomentosus]|nr:hypothetical protein C8R48DRAFT_696820 [Suillus tomentosus]
MIHCQRWAKHVWCRIHQLNGKYATTCSKLVCRMSELLASIREFFGSTCKPRKPLR